MIDVQLHFVRDDYQWDGILKLGEYAKHWNEALRNTKIDFDLFKFDNFLKEVYFDSDTKVGLISAAPADHGSNVIMGNDGLAAARNFINAAAGSRRVLAHTVMAPGQPGWLDEIDRAIVELKPDSWKGYTLGDPFEDSQYPWRLDDEQLMYPRTNACESRHHQRVHPQRSVAGGLHDGRPSIGVTRWSTTWVKRRKTGPGSTSSSITRDSGR